MATVDPPIGAVVEIPAGRGIVRFNSTTSFSPGRWVGIELSEPIGKNNGSVQGVTYFQCRMNYGVFVRPSQVKIISTVAERPSSGVDRDRPGPGSRATPPTVSRPTLGHQRTSSSTGLTRATSSRSIPPASPRAVSPAKPSTSTSAMMPPPPPPTRPRLAPSPTKRTSSVGLQPRQSLPRTSSTSSVVRTESPLSETERAPAVASSRQLTSPVPEARCSSRLSSSPLVQTPSFPPTSSVHPVAPVIEKENSRSSQDEELQEVRAKIRVLEAKRADDARNIEKLESQLSEANSFVALRPKLQAKLNTLQQDLIATRRALSDAEQLANLNEGRLLDTQEQLEMAMLDKEVAEERAEAAEAEMETIKERLAVVEVELESVKEGGGGSSATDGEAPVKQSLAYTQLEKHNERLKEALIRLRDVSHETETEQRHRINELERELSGVDDLHSQYDSALIKLSNAETQIEDLKLQLDDALGAEEMLVQLTERNLMLGEKIEEMRITIEDLEALKELNDELEENHVETEKTMQEDLDLKDSQMREQTRKIEALDDNCQDLENTISQFRELVMQLQTDLDNLRAQTQSAQSESASAASQSAAMMSLNLKLQSSASKNQARNIELELRKLDARESKELLGIVQPYLPQIYVESDTDATNCYMFFQRMAYKADLINNIIAQAHGLPESLNGPVSEVLVGICEMRGRISILSTLGKRFAAILRRCDVESFLNIGRIYPEIAPMEKRLDMHIDLLRREEFREMECISDVMKMQAQFEHLAESYFNGFEHDIGERELGLALSFDSDLDIFAASIGLTKTALDALMKDDDVLLELDDLDADVELFEPLQRLLSQSKGAKALSRKLTRRLEDLVLDSSALKTTLIPQLQALDIGTVPELVNFGIQLAQHVIPQISEIRNSKQVFQLKPLLLSVRQIAASTVGKGKNESGASWSSISESLANVVHEAGVLLPLVVEAENVLKISGTPPWVTRIDEIKAVLAVNVEAERKVAQLNEEIQGLVRGIKIKDQHVQEAGVKIELMERRMEAVKKQADTIADLESELSKARKQERAYGEAVEQLQSDLDTLEQENTKLKAMGASSERQPSGTQLTEPESVAVEGSLETSHLLEQIEALRGAVRFLRHENAYLKGQDLLREIRALPPLPEPNLRPPTPPLDPSNHSDSDESDSESENIVTPPTLRSLASETRMLYHDVITFSSSPRVIDLSTLNQTRTNEHKGGKVWMPKKQTPAYQLLERKMQAERLSRRVQGLFDRASALGVGR
ncbi:dynactin [Rickenella mellea]|uniref:Dynactin n=1 Tax=Rickenella mellea TaxID=50990 RepID=A0A4Y7QFF6_9AGAM|nr:dynactin [Rickenella mellea]